METESDSTLLFLDVHVSRDPCKRIQTTVYRKHTHSDQYIHFNSNHTPKTKSRVIWTLTKRAKNICSSSHDLEHKLNHLQHVFTSLNQYPSNLVKRTISSTVHNKPKVTKPDSALIRITLPYIGKISHHISRLLKHQAGIKTIFTGSPSLKTILLANGHNLPSKNATPKKSNLQDLLWMWGLLHRWNLPSRWYPHKRTWNLNSQRRQQISPLRSPTEIPFPSKQFDQFKILSAKNQDFTKRKLLEAIEICRHKPLINRH